MLDRRSLLTGVTASVTMTSTMEGSVAPPLRALAAIFLYTTRADVRQEIDQIVANSLTEEPTVMVGHSLGSVVAYSVLRSDCRLAVVPTGPLGAVVGGTVGAAVGTVGGILGVEDRPRFREYVVRERIPSYRYEQELRVGTVLPEQGSLIMRCPLSITSRVTGTPM